MSLFTTLEQYAEEILDAVKARAQQLEQAFGTHSPELTHIVSTLEAHVATTTPAAPVEAPIAVEPVAVEPVAVEPVAVEPVVEVPAAVEVTEEK